MIQGLIFTALILIMIKMGMIWQVVGMAIGTIIAFHLWEFYFEQKIDQWFECIDEWFKK